MEKSRENEINGKPITFLCYTYLRDYFSPAIGDAFLFLRAELSKTQRPSLIFFLRFGRATVYPRKPLLCNDRRFVSLCHNTLKLIAILFLSVPDA